LASVLFASAGFGGGWSAGAYQQIVKTDNFVKSRILPFFWIPAFAGMTIMQLISGRYHRRHTREGGYPVFKTTFYDSIKNYAKKIYLNS